MLDEPPPKAKKPRPVVLATTDPYLTFDPGVEGVGPITNAGTRVPASQASAVHEAAAAANVTLKEN